MLKIINKLSLVLPQLTKLTSEIATLDGKRHNNQHNDSLTFCTTHEVENADNAATFTRAQQLLRWATVWPQ